MISNYYNIADSEGNMRTATNDTDRERILESASSADYEDESSCLLYDYIDVPTMESDKERIPSKTFEYTYMRVVMFLLISSTDCEDDSFCLPYNGTDAPTEESDSEMVLGKAFNVVVL